MEEKMFVQDIISDGGQYARDGWMFLRGKEPNLEGRVERFAEGTANKDISRELKPMVGNDAKITISRAIIGKEKLYVIVDIKVEKWGAGCESVYLERRDRIIAYREIDRARLHGLRGSERKHKSHAHAERVSESQRSGFGLFERSLERPKLKGKH